MLVPSNFSFSQNVFHSYISLERQNAVLCGNGINDYNQVPQPFPRQQTLDSSKLQEFADDNLKFDDNGKKFPEQLENTVGKGEITR